MSKGDVSAVRPETVLRGHKDAVNCLGFLSADILSSGSLDGVLKLWTLSSRRAVASIDAHGGSLLSINVLFHSSSILTCGRDGLTKLWQIDRESPSLQNTPVLSLQTGSRHFCNSSCDRGYLSDPNMVVTPSAEESEISIWDLRAASSRVGVVRQASREQAGAGPVAERGMVFTLLLQSQYCNESTLNNMENEELEKEPQDSRSVLSASVPRFLAGYEDGSLSCIDIRTFRPVCSVRPHEDPVMAMDLSPSGLNVVSGGGDSKLARTSLKTVDATVVELIGTAKAMDRQPSSSSSWARAEAIPDANPVLENGGEEKELSISFEDQDSLLLPSKGTSCIRHRSDGRILVTGHWDNSFRIYDAKRMKPLAVVRHHRDKIYAVDFAPSYTDSFQGTCRPGMFATGSKDCTIAVWNVFEDTMR